MRPGPSAGLSGWALSDLGGVGARSGKNDWAIPARQRPRAAVGVNSVGTPRGKRRHRLAAGHPGIRRGLENPKCARRQHPICNLADADGLLIMQMFPGLNGTISRTIFGQADAAPAPLARSASAAATTVCSRAATLRPPSVAMLVASGATGMTLAGTAEHTTHPRPVRSLRAAGENGTMAATDRRRARRRAIQDHQMAKSGLAPMPQIRAR